MHDEFHEVFRVVRKQGSILNKMLRQARCPDHSSSAEKVYVLSLTYPEQYSFVVCCRGIKSCYSAFILVTVDGTKSCTILTRL